MEILSLVYAMQLHREVGVLRKDYSSKYHQRSAAVRTRPFKELFMSVQ